MDLNEYKEKHPKLTDRLDKMERRSKEAEILLDLKEHAGVQRLMAELESEIKGIENLLLNKRMTEHERDLLFSDRDRCNWFLGKFAHAEMTIVNIDKYLEKL